MNKILKVATAALLFGASTSASATTILFSFSDGTTQDFYGRTHVAGTVKGALIGLTNNATSAPTAIQIFSSPDPIQLVEGIFTSTFQFGGFTLVNGNLTAANFAFNFKDGASNSFQLRFNCNSGGAFGCSGAQSNLNLLFWNGGNTPVNGTGNQAGFSGVSYSSVLSAVPEPSTWAMMLVGFGLIGFASRRRQRVSVRFA